MASASELIVDSVAEIVGGLIEGDRQLQRLGFERTCAAVFDRGRLGPSDLDSRVLFAREMSVNLRYACIESGTREFLFGLLGTEEFEEKVADIRLRLGIKPSLEPNRRLTEAPLVTFAAPGFLERATVPGVLRLRLSEGALLIVDRDPGGALKLRRADGTPIDDRNGWPFEVQVALIETLADWLRNSSYGPGRPLRPEARNILDKLLQTIVDRFGDLVDVLAKPIPYQTGTGGHALAELLRRCGGETYFFSSIAARILVNLDSKGAMLTNADETDRQQVDLEGRLVPATMPPVVELRYHLPDLLVSGNKYHRRFVNALRDESSVKVLFKAGANREASSRGELKRFLLAPETGQSAVFLRSIQEAGDRKERNVVLLKGELAGIRCSFLFEARFQVTSFPEVAVRRLRSANLLASKRGDEEWLPFRSNRLLEEYFARNFALLAHWQERTMDGVPS